jgi:D-alanyl-D-alanine carboxypeptidase/LAS superfamily LD-carboxypeptidase LdcB
MDSSSKKSLIKIILWSVIAIGFGVVFSGLVVHAVSKQDISSKSENKESLSQKVLAYAGKVKALTLAQDKNSANVLNSLNFNDIIRAPEATYHLRNPDLLPNIGAMAYVIGDVDTGEIIASKNSEIVSPIASVTKLMTALTTLEDLNQSETVKVSSKALNTEGYSGGLHLGETMKVSDIIYPLLLVSSNDAAEVLAEHDGRESFMTLMNRNAKELGMENTIYEDPSGLSSHNKSTAKDLFILANYLFTKHRTVFDITKLNKFSAAGQTWLNANYFTNHDNYLGGKTGYTSLAQRTGVAIFSIPFGDQTRNIGITLLKTQNRIDDINKILAYVKSNVYYAYDNSSNQEVTLGFVGDIMLDRGVKTSIIKNFGGDYNKIFSQAKALKNPDIMFGNLEGPISDKGHNVGSIYSFRMDPLATPAMKSAGFDIVSFANNHVGDYSDEAFLDTLGRLKENNILFTGAGETYEEAKKPTIIERNGIRVGYLGFSDVGPEFMKATETKPGILLANDKNFSGIISEAKKSVDVLIVSVHWGDEYKPHTQRQETLAKKAIDAGADLIIGSHPHVAQDVQEYKDGLIVYSLGNFIFDQSFSDETMQGLYEKVTITKDGIKNHEETTFKLNSSYQPVLADDTNKSDETISSYPFERGSCPVGNSDNDQTFANVNANNSVDKYIPEGLVEIKSQIPTKDSRNLCLNEEVANQLKKLYDSAKTAGVDIEVTSGFRDYSTQEILYSNRVKDVDVESIAIPGHSEHQLGTTVDLSTSEINGDSASSEFKNTSAYKWLSNNAYKYGFTMSYPQGRSTGYIFEPWHYRYLGVDEATEVKNKNLTIQEYLESL